MQTSEVRGEKPKTSSQTKRTTKLIVDNNRLSERASTATNTKFTRNNFMNSGRIIKVSSSSDMNHSTSALTKAYS